MDAPPPVAGISGEFGPGDTLYTAFFSPKHTGKVIWGVGPVILVPTSTADTLGTGGDVWTLPIVGGVGKLTKFGSCPQTSGSTMSRAPWVGPEWRLRLQVHLLFPK